MHFCFSVVHFASVQPTHQAVGNSASDALPRLEQNNRVHRRSQNISAGPEASTILTMKVAASTILTVTGLYAAFSL